MTRLRCLVVSVVVLRCWFVRSRARWFEPVPHTSGWWASCGAARRSVGAALTLRCMSKHVLARFALVGSVSGTLGTRSSHLHCDL